MVEPLRQALLVVVAALVLGPSGTWGVPPPGPRQVLAQYPPGNTSASFRINHMVVDPKTGDLYVGAVNKILKLAPSSLTVRHAYETGPRLDSPLCHASGCVEEHRDKETLMDNVNKLLILDSERDTLIACGSVHQGSCDRLNVSDLSPVPGNRSTEALAANDEKSSTYAFIGPQSYYPGKTANVLYVGTTFTNNAGYRHDVPAISSRKLTDLTLAESSFSKASMIQIEVQYRDHFLVQYVYGFSVNQFAYFVVVQKQSHLPDQEEKGFFTRLARTCINDANYDSYTEVTLQCMVPQRGKLVDYNVIRDAKVAAAGDDLADSLHIRPGDPVLIGAFSPSEPISSKPQSKSALCVYSLKDIEHKFNENIHMCFNGSLQSRSLDYISGKILDGKCAEAGVSTPHRR